MNNANSIAGNSIGVTTETTGVWLCRDGREIQINKMTDSHYPNAEEFAITWHATQKYGEMPYSYHLNYVVNILLEYGYGKDDAIVAAGWLHDTLEDTDVTYQMLVSEFGREISDIVFAVTNEPGRNRAERFRNTVPKIVANKKALIVKLADRIANGECSKHADCIKLYQMYQREFPVFKQSLFESSVSRLDCDCYQIRSMWDRLCKLFEA